MGTNVPNLGNDDLDNDFNFAPPTKRIWTVKSIFTVKDRQNSVFSVRYLRPFDKRGDNDIPLLDEDSDKAIEFQNVFRVPYILFLSIASSFANKKQKTDVTSKRLVDHCLLVLGLLCLLAWGGIFKSLKELTCVSQMTHRVFFLEKFLVWGENLACDNIFLLRTDKEYNAVKSLHCKKGLPGCFGSIDCVHVTWDNCHSGLKGECKGKAPNPTLAFEVVVDHDLCTWLISTYNFGAQNDKTIA